MKPGDQSSGPLAGRFFDYLLGVNRPRLNDFAHWLFLPGMLFQAREQWWGEEKSRPTLHEGLDLCWYEDISGQRRQLDQTIIIPSAFSGTVVKISPDFLGQSIFLAHGRGPEVGRRLYTAFGHTRPVERLAAGQAIAEGEIIASVSSPDNRKTKVPPHLHLTLALLSEDIGPDQLTWDYLGSAKDIALLDPLVIFPTSYALI
jgi:Peptidase family M23